MTIYRDGKNIKLMLDKQWSAAWLAELDRLEKRPAEIGQEVLTANELMTLVDEARNILEKALN